MTTLSGDANGERPCCCPAAGASGQLEPEADLSELLHRFRQRIDGIRATGRNGASATSGPADLALTVVAEALAIGEAMSRITTDGSADGSFDGTGAPRSPAIYADIDSRFVEHRARALRSALHGVDDYVWWGGLAAATG